MSADTAKSERVLAVDGVRGLLAALVVLKHATELAGWRLSCLHWASQVAVLLFFALSGYVLTRGWRGDFATFLLLRFVRLWPVYALTLAVGFAVTGAPLQAGLFFWWPAYVLDGRPAVNLPAWSLHIEAWAMLAMPLIVWIGTGSLRRIGFGLAAVTLAACFQPLIGFGYFFLAGAALARWTWRNRGLESWAPQALGQISYSLYLTHWLLFVAVQRTFGPGWVLPAIPLSLALGWLVWRLVERPSLAASRRIGATLRSGARSLPRAAPYFAAAIRSTPPM